MSIKAIAKKIEELADQVSSAAGDLARVDDDEFPVTCDKCGSNVIMWDEPIESFLTTSCPVCAVMQMGEMFLGVRQLFQEGRVHDALALIEVGWMASNELYYEPYKPASLIASGKETLADMLRDAESDIEKPLESYDAERQERYKPAYEMAEKTLKTYRALLELDATLNK